MSYTPLPRRVRFDRFELDAANADLRKDGHRLRLRPQALTLLALLVDRAGELVSREELRATLWADDTFVDFDHSLNVTIGEIRRALSDAASRSRLIETVPRRGYRFVAPVEVVDARALRRRATDLATPQEAPVALVAPQADDAGSAAPEASPAEPPRGLARVPRWALLASAAGLALLLAVSSGAARLPWATGAEPGPVGSAAVPATPSRGSDTTNAMARQAYARARVHWARRNDCPRAVAEYRAAAAADPTFALPWVGIADCFTISGDREEAQQAIREATTRAPDLGELHASRGLARMFLSWDWRGARTSLETAMRLAPEYASAHQWAGVLAIFERRADEARALLARAATLDPTSPTIATDQALAEILAGRPTEALAHCQQARRLAPDHQFTAPCFVAAYTRLGRPRDVLAALTLDAALATDADAARRLAAFYRQEVVRVRSQTPVVDYAIAQRLAALGQHEEALVHLARAVEQREFMVPFAVVEPDFDGLRQHPQFEALLDRAGLLSPQR